MNKVWKHRTVIADNAFVRKVEDLHTNGTVRVNFSYRVDGRTNVNVTELAADLTVNQVASLVEQTRTIADAQIERMQVQRRRLG